MTERVDELEQQVARCMPALRAFVRLRMGAELRRREESCDLLQSVVREVLQQRDRFRWGGEQGFREWLFTTAHRKVADRLDHWRAAKRTAAREAAWSGDLPTSSPSPSRHAAAREELAALERLFDDLSAEQRDVVTWSRLLGLSHAEIAVRLGKSEVAVRKILSRALARLAAVSADHESVTDDRR